MHEQFWIIYLFLCLVSFFSFGTSVLHTFRKHSESLQSGYNLLKLSNILAWVTGVFVIVNSKSLISFEAYLLGSIFQIFSLVFFYWLKFLVKKRFSIAFSLDTPQFLFREGPYKRIRHPFYTCYLLNYLSIAVVMGSLLNLMAFLFNVFVYVWAAKLEERKFLQSDLKHDYLGYIQEAGMFLPRIWKRS